MTSNEVEAYEAPGGVQILGSAVDTSIAQLEAHARAMSTAHKLASAMCNTDLVPKMYKGNASNGTAAILYGMELGLNPIQSLQNIFVVHGTPAIYARTMVALVKSKGYKVWTVESSDESVTVSGRAPGDEHVTTSTWTIERAVKAGYVPQVDPKTGEFKKNQYGKLIGNEKYLTDPQAMLYAKAASEVSRKIAPEVLLGLSHSAEDLQSEAEPVRAESSRVVDTGESWKDRLGIKASEPVDITDHATEAEPEPKSAPESVKEEPVKAEPKKRAPASKTQAKPAEKPEPATEPASEEGAKPEPEQVKPSYTIPKDAATPEQLTELGRLLDAEGATSPEAKLEWINQSFTTAYINALQVTTKQAADAIKYLSAPAED
ncbi:MULTISPECIES: hypothetical protein [Nocardiaceae]|uniref:hypothetical protein n=1 Tax=Nocardiaceae TaxID=85025 RepID=UPI00068CD6DE|nr:MULTISPECIES: hypothetical protein [Rhodococcus]